jgi:hypothetical protein
VAGEQWPNCPWQMLTVGGGVCVTCHKLQYCHGPRRGNWQFGRALLNVLLRNIWRVLDRRKQGGGLEGQASVCQQGDL